MGFGEFLKFVLIGTIWFLVALGEAAVISVWFPFSGFWGAAVVCVLWASSFWFPQSISRYINFWVIALTGIAAFGAQYHFNDWYQLETGEVVSDISPADIKNYPKAAAFEFRQAIVRKDYAGHSTSWSKGTGGGFHYEHFHAAPLTTISWKPSDPITAWLVENTAYSNISYGLDQNIQSAVLARSWPRHNFSEAESDALSRYNLKSAEPPIFLEEVSSIAAAKQRKSSLLFGLAVGPWLIFFLGSVLSFICGGFSRAA